AQAVFAAIQLAWGRVRAGGRPEEAERALRDVESLLASAPAELLSLWRATLEDVYFMMGKPSAALQTRVLRWRDDEGGDEVGGGERARSALAIAGASEAVNAERSGILDWYRVAFEHGRSP